MSLPTFVARKRKAPVWLIVAPMTVSPASFVTGSDSPVTIDSSMVERPSTISPSTGIFSPGRTSDDVTRHHLLDRDLDFLSVADDAGRLRLQADELADGLAGAGLRARLEQAAEEDEREDDADRLVVDLAEVLREGIGRDGHDQAVGERRDRAERDQRVHVGRAVAQGEPAGAMDRPARVDHHRRDERQLEPAVEQEVRASSQRRRTRGASP